MKARFKITERKRFTGGTEICMEQLSTGISYSVPSYKIGCEEDVKATINVFFNIPLNDIELEF